MLTHTQALSQMCFHPYVHVRAHIYTPVSGTWLLDQALGLAMQAVLLQDLTPTPHH